VTDLVISLPCRRPELTIRPLGEKGQHVVKDPRTGEFYCLGPVEYFLLMRLDGEQSAEEVAAAFEQHFGEPLSEEDLSEFVELAEARGLLRIAECKMRPAERIERIPHSALPISYFNQSLLSWRKTLWDPDRLFTWLAPRIGFFWTRTFLALSAGSILLAVGLLWANQHELASSFGQAWRWETALLVWLTLFFVTMLHESAHGLTCKHYGGEVHEIGFLLLYFMPCFYCNVSDSWLFREKSKRLWVMFAGGYIELFLWSLAVFVWRLTMPGMLFNHLAFVVLSVCGVQTLFNFNPLLKLDGYYLLSDWLEIPNLQQRAMGYAKAQLRRLLWGAAPPAREPSRGALLSYGLLSWIYSLAFLGLMLLGIGRLVGTPWGLVGLAAVSLLVIPSARGLVRGLSAGEVQNMIRLRHKRTVCWILGLAALVAAGLCQIEDRPGGACCIRPLARVELRAPLAGFIAAVNADEGDRLSPGQCAIRLHIPDLDSRCAQKQAETRESEARLKLLETGSRPEELAQQRQRAQRALGWRDLATEDLRHARDALVADLLRLEHGAAKARAELEAARQRFQRAEGLARTGAVTKDQHEQIQLEMRIAQLDGEQLQAARSAAQSKGTREAEAELARREKELADQQGALALLEAGTRPEEIEAERARLARLQEELHYLQAQRDKLPVSSPVAGIVTTPRLKEKVGQYVHEGDLLCLVEEPAMLEAEIALGEQQIERLQAGQLVRLKLRAVPAATFWGRVDRVAPAAVKDDKRDPQAHVIVYCRFDAGDAELRVGMTGYARISTGRRCLGAILANRALRLLRTEYWW
jgi:putative peptide zinc metalloprotease protein